MKNIDLKKKIDIKEALEIMQNIRYFDQNGNIVFLMDESEEMDYLKGKFIEYDCSKKQFYRVLRIADKLEKYGLINTNNFRRNDKNSCGDNIISPLIRIKRKNNYKKVSLFKIF